MNDYREAARALKQVMSGRSGVKTAVFAVKPRNIKRCFALVAEAAKRLPLLRTLAKQLGPQGRDADQSMIYILLQEHCFGKGGRGGKSCGIVGGGRLKRLIEDHDAALRSYLERNPSAPPDSSAEASAARKEASPAAAPWPRYVRVNTLLGSVDEVAHALTAAAPRSSSTGGSSAPTPSSAGALLPSEVSVDAHLPMVLVLPPDAHKRLVLHAHPLVTSGRVVLQDKASAMPPYALMEDLMRGTSARAEAVHAAAGGAEPLQPVVSGGGPFDAIDACAAPGNKTTQLAALLARMQLQAQSSSQTGRAPSPATRSVSGLEGGQGSSGSKKRKRDAAHARDSSEAAAAARTVPRIWAFDRSADRLKTLRERVALALGDRTPLAIQAPTASGSAGGGKKQKGSTAVRSDAIEDTSTTLACNADVQVACAGGDFTAALPSDPQYARVRVILLDPSCSGSGMVKSHGEVASHASASSSSSPLAPVPPRSEEGRVSSLATFQTRALTHALLFPQVVRVSYSTCSVYAQENELVVRDAVRGFNAVGAVDAVTGRRVQARLVKVLPSWTHRGIPPPTTKDEAGAGALDDPLCLDWSCCIRCEPSTDRTGGFFVAVIHKFLLPA